MDTMLRALAFVLLSLAACGSPPSQPPVSWTGMRLRCSPQHGLYLDQVPAGYGVAKYFYVLAHNPVPHTDDRPRIGMVVARHQEGRKESLMVSVVCPLAELPGADGSPAVGVAEDTFQRVGKCVGKFIGQDDARWVETQTFADLVLDLGDADSIAPGDVYDVLGDPIIDDLNHVVRGFEQIGECAVQRDTSGAARTTCRLDRTEWPKFTRERWVRGGSVRYHPVVPPPDPCPRTEPRH